MDQRPLPEVVAGLFQQNRQLSHLDTEIAAAIATLEQRLREMGVNRIFSARLPDGADLGWSLNRRTRQWRFVIRDEDEAWELWSCSREERAEVFTCGAMAKLIAQIQEARGVDARRKPQDRRSAHP